MAHAKRQFAAFGEIFVGLKITHMHGFLIQECTPGSPVTVDRPFLMTDRYRTMVCAEAQILPILQSHSGIIGIAKFACAFDDGLKNRRNIGWRGSNHAEDVAAPGLVSQRLLQLPGFGLHLFEQPNVPDGDHRLSGKS